MMGHVSLSLEQHLCVLGAEDVPRWRRKLQRDSGTLEAWRRGPRRGSDCEGTGWAVFVSRDSETTRLT